MRIVGLDEAGRGCVLGPLLVGAFAYDAEDMAPLRDAGADDSKALSPAQRARARERLDRLGIGVVTAIDPARIDEGNLNELELTAFLGHVAALRPDRVYLDAPVHPKAIPALKRRLIAASGVSDWVVEPKADATYPVVGAASIYAKLERDAAITALGPVGSGYPSDPVTRRWLADRLAEPGPLPACIRTRWGTIERLRQATLFPR